MAAAEAAAEAATGPRMLLEEMDEDSDFFEEDDGDVPEEWLAREQAVTKCTLLLGNAAEFASSLNEVLRIIHKDLLGGSPGCTVGVRLENSAGDMPMLAAVGAPFELTCNPGLVDPGFDPIRTRGEKPKPHLACICGLVSRGCDIEDLAQCSPVPGAFVAQNTAAVDVSKLRDVCDGHVRGHCLRLFKSLSILPIVGCDGRRVNGVLLVGSDVPKAFDEHLVECLQSIARAIGCSYANSAGLDVIRKQLTASLQQLSGDFKVAFSPAASILSPLLRAVDVGVTDETDRIIMGSRRAQGLFGTVFPEATWNSAQVVLRGMSWADPDLVMPYFQRIQQLRHPNVLEIFHVARTRGHLFLVEARVTESVETLLAEKVLAPDSDVLYELAMGVALGMAYITSSGLVHGSLASPRVLYALEDDRYHAKIVSVGFRVLLPTPTPSRLAHAFARFDPPEAGDQDWEPNSQSDVWAFGVFLWELWSLGAKPYGRMSNAKVLPFVRSGGRLQRPDKCPDGVFGLMLQCWDADPAKRPTFASLAESLDGLLLKKHSELAPQRIVEVNPSTSSGSVQGMRASFNYSSELVGQSGDYQPVQQQTPPAPQASPKEHKPAEPSTTLPVKSKVCILL